MTCEGYEATYRAQYGEPLPDNVRRILHDTHTTLDAYRDRIDALVQIERLEVDGVVAVDDPVQS